MHVTSIYTRLNIFKFTFSWHDTVFSKGGYTNIHPFTFSFYNTTQTFFQWMVGSFLPFLSSIFFLTFIFFYPMSTIEVTLVVYEDRPKKALQCPSGSKHTCLGNPKPPCNKSGYSENLILEKPVGETERLKKHIEIKRYTQQGPNVWDPSCLSLPAQTLDIWMSKFLDDSSL